MVFLTNFPWERDFVQFFKFEKSVYLPLSNPRCAQERRAWLVGRDHDGDGGGVKEGGGRGSPILTCGGEEREITLHSSQNSTTLTVVMSRGKKSCSNMPHMFADLFVMWCQF